MIDRQLELGLNGNRGTRFTARERRLSRASWWFARMRKVVDHAFDWQPAPVARPEQTCFANAFRQPSLDPANTQTPRGSWEARLLCE